MLLIEAFAIFLSVITLLQFVAYGSKNRCIGPAVGVVVAIFWIVYCLITLQWGLQILNVGAVLIHGWNFIKWRKQNAGS